jgi:DNA polymerase III epsilon subunit-like protein
MRSGKGQGKNKDTGDEVYISVDIEAAGPVPGEYSMLSLGACVVTDPEITFYTEFKPINDHFVPAALKVGGLALEQLAITGHSPAEAMRDFDHWIREAAKNRTPVFVGFNASFDWAFVNWYFHVFLGENPFGIGALDIKAYYMGLAGSLWRETTSSQLPRQFQPTHHPTHNALDDAIAQAQIFRKLLEAAQRNTDRGGL